MATIDRTQIVPVGCLELGSEGFAFLNEMDIDSIQELCTYRKDWLEARAVTLGYVYPALLIAKISNALNEANHNWALKPRPEGAT